MQSNIRDNNEKHDDDETTMVMTMMSSVANEILHDQLRTISYLDHIQVSGMKKISSIAMSSVSWLLDMIILQIIRCTLRCSKSVKRYIYILSGKTTSILRDVSTSWNALEECWPARRRDRLNNPPKHPRDTCRPRVMASRLTTCHWRLTDSWIRTNKTDLGRSDTIG